MSAPARRRPVAGPPVAAPEPSAVAAGPVPPEPADPPAVRAPQRGVRPDRLPVEYVLPLRWSDDADLAELTGYLRSIAALVDVTVVDGSPPEVFARHAAAWRGVLRHAAPDPAVRGVNGKVRGVLTGVAMARHEHVVIADDDVRYDEPGLRAVHRLLDTADLVRPQNYFDPLPWHAWWDTGRTLLNRALAADYPGTLAVRRSTFRAMGGYDPDVLFENLELIRTVRAYGGTEAAPAGLHVRRLPPTAAHFRGQRVRQAYDDLAQPVRLLTSLAVLPGVLAALAATSALSGLGLGWIGGLARSGDSQQWTSPPTAVGFVVDYLGELTGRRPSAVPVARTVALVLLAVLLGVLWWRAWSSLRRLNDVRQRVHRLAAARPRVVLFGAGLALAATVALAPVFHPWYATWPLAVLAVSAVRTTWFVLPSAVAAFLTLPDGTTVARYGKAPGAIAMTVLVVALAGWAVRARRTRTG
ncbi:hypothetical protein ABT214_08760 [Micromonospora purpureochromogenes]|uniref:glycosyltransferase n=1 Tax=Micromonospora purpureochromogenes TaxID=47872 RepID=UPI0033210E96